VIGRKFDLEVLAPLVDMTRHDLVIALDESVDARVPYETGVGQYAFSHALVQSSLYDELRTTRRACMHERVAETTAGSGATTAWWTTIGSGSRATPSTRSPTTARDCARLLANLATRDRLRRAARDPAGAPRRGAGAGSHHRRPRHARPRAHLALRRAVASEHADRAAGAPLLHADARALRVRFLG